ncbi:hypothetical protein LSH36_842g00008 [Paralvinella palmiformis]|uniref:G-protein coupled receptors family 1 profile domain-containing protein n=1 Tax=Paralvinella palmiformis TaxID=53620 RepID=A0AAD9IZW4_9ANNE|nr:hypothetical protein LSH36_842g00008 [Paralvinella palmiformis]
MNTSSPHDDEHSEIAVTNYITAAATLLLLIVGVLIGFLGNGLICFCMWKIRSLRTPVNNLILNMAVVGIMASVTCLPLKVSLVACQSLGIHFADTRDIIVFFVVLHSLNLFFTSIQLMTLASISFERYQAIAKPFEKTKRSRRVRKLLLLTWSIAAANWLSYIVTELQAWNKSNQYIDLFIYDKWFFVSGFLPFSILVICTIVVFYSQIVRLISQHVKRRNIRIEPWRETPPINRKSSLLVKRVESVSASSQMTVSSERRELHPNSNLNAYNNYCSEAGNNLNISDLQKLDVETNLDVANQQTNFTDKTRRLKSDDVTTTDISVFNRENGKRRFEAKTAKLAGMVLAIFFALWLPYQIYIIQYFRMYGPSREKLTDIVIFSSTELITQTLAIGAVFICPFVFIFVNIDLRRETTMAAKRIILRCKSDEL